MTLIVHMNDNIFILSPKRMMKLTGLARGHLMMFIPISMHLIKCNPGQNYLLESLPMFCC